MLEVKDLHCSYGTTQVLKGVDLNVNKEIGRASCRERV